MTQKRRGFYRHRNVAACRPDYNYESRGYQHRHWLLEMRNHADIFAGWACARGGSMTRQYHHIGAITLIFRAAGDAPVRVMMPEWLLANANIYIRRR